jgi:hypothetical protein
MSVFASPRPLTASERDVLTRVLTAEFAGAAELREQLRLARVTGAWGEGELESPSIDLAVPETTTRSSCPDGPIPIRAIENDERGEYCGELLVWIQDGRLSALEYATISDDVPAALPNTARIQLTVK